MNTQYVESGRYRLIRSITLVIIGMAVGVGLSILAVLMGHAARANTARVYTESPVVIECTWRGCGRAVL